MDYKAKIQGNVQSLGHKIAGMQEALDNTKHLFEAYLTENLELMYNELAKRNGYQATLSKEEKEIIHYVESGRLKQDIESMPKVLADELKNRTERMYMKAKKSMPLDELVVCGILDSKQETEGKRTLILTLPVRFSEREKTESLEESLYAYNINKGNFDSEKDYKGFVQFELSELEVKTIETAENLVISLEKGPLPEKLSNANVKYNIISIIKETLYKSPQELPVDVKTKLMQPYTTGDAAKIWREHELAKGKNIPLNILRSKVINFIKSSTPYFDATRDAKGDYQINPGSFLAFIGSVTIEKKGNRWIPRIKEPQPPIKIESPKVSEFYTGREITNLMLERLEADKIYVPYKNAYWIIKGVEDRENLEFRPLIKRTEDGSILFEKNSADDFLKHYLIRPGKGKKHKYYLAKRSKQFNGVTDLIGREISINQAMSILDSSKHFIYARLRKGELTLSRPGYVLGQSLKDFLNTHEKRGGPEKTFWMEK